MDQTAAAKRTVVLFEVLTSSPHVRRAALSWPLVPLGLKRIATLKKWSRVSGIGIDTLEEISEMLIAHDVCRADRTIDPEAERIMGHLVAEQLRKKPKR